MPDETQQAIEGEVIKLVTSEGKLSTELSEIESELQQEPRFKAFLEKQAELRQIQAESAEAWKRIEAQMIEHNIKSIKGDWGTISIAERKNFRGDLKGVPPRFIKKTLDTTKISKHYDLYNELPKGIELSITKYLTKRIK